MKRELITFGCWAVIIPLAFWLTGCLTMAPTPPAATSSKFSSPDPVHVAPLRTTNVVAIPAPPIPGRILSAVILRTNVAVAGMVVARSPRMLTLSWNAPLGPVAFYLLALSHGNQQWYKRINVGTNTTVNLTNYAAPLEFQVTAVSTNGFESAPSNEAYYGANTNGSVWQVNGQIDFGFVAMTTSVYALSNAPLTANKWASLTTFSNRSGLVTVPLSNTSGRIKLVTWN